MILNIIEPKTTLQNLTSYKQCFGAEFHGSRLWLLNPDVYANIFNLVLKIFWYYSWCNKETLPLATKNLIYRTIFSQHLLNVNI